MLVVGWLGSCKIIVAVVVRFYFRENVVSKPHLRWPEMFADSVMWRLLFRNLIVTEKRNSCVGKNALILTAAALNCAAMQKRWKQQQQQIYNIWSLFWITLHLAVAASHFRSHETISISLTITTRKVTTVVAVRLGGSNSSSNDFTKSSFECKINENKHNIRDSK